MVVQSQKSVFLILKSAGVKGRMGIINKQESGVQMVNQLKGQTGQTMDLLIYTQNLMTTLIYLILLVEHHKLEKQPQ